MTTTNGTEPARLLCLGGAFSVGARRPISKTVQIREGTVDELIAWVAEQDSDELWRYTIVTIDDDHHIRGADLRQMIGNPQ